MKFNGFKNINKSSRFVPTIIAISTVIGMIIGSFFTNRFSGNRLNIINTSSNKLNDLMHIIDDQYVDTVSIAELVEMAMPEIMSELDPHSTYISAKEAKSIDDDLKGSFSGIGVQFVIREDTIHITNIIKGGPSEFVGLLAGDKIVSIDGKEFVGKEVTNEEAMHRLKGEKYSKVKLGVKRHGEDKTLYFTIVRGDVPIRSIDATYMLTDELGYIKVKSFGETTYAEMLNALAELQEKSFKGLVIDLRGNGGGYLEPAVLMVNEFLPKNRLIVYTEGRKYKRKDYTSDGRGSYQDLPLIVLTDESTASASEIFSGAIQDNDRGMIVGRRTFGKGLVQRPIDFSDGSLIRLTIARYYTPSGRCIQKPYTKGAGPDKEYELDLQTRYERGEFFSQDSIHQNGPVYKTSIGRSVYGGGGIMPDYFVAEDTTGFTSYYTEVASKGLIAQYSFIYTDNNREELSKFETPGEIVEYLRKNKVIEQFIKFADSKGVKRRNLMIQKSQSLFEQSLYGSIIYNIMDMDNYMEYINQNNNTIKKAIEIYNEKKTVPVLEGNEKKGKSHKEAARVKRSGLLHSITHYNKFTACIG